MVSFEVRLIVSNLRVALFKSFKRQIVKQASRRDLAVHVDSCKFLQIIAN